MCTMQNVMQSVQCNAKCSVLLLTGVLTSLAHSQNIISIPCENVVGRHDLYRRKYVCVTKIYFYGRMCYVYPYCTYLPSVFYCILGLRFEIRVVRIPVCCAAINYPLRANRHYVAGKNTIECGALVP